MNPNAKTAPASQNTLMVLVCIGLIAQAFFQQAALASDSSGDKGAASSPRSELATQWVLRVRDATVLRAALEQNDWLKEFASGPLGAGLLSRALPLLTATPDEFGSAKQAWSGRLMDWLLEAVVTRRPLILAGLGHNRPAGRRSLLLAIPQLSPSEAAAASGLLRSLTFGEWQSDKPNDIRLKGQAFWGWIQQRCLIIAHDQEIARQAQRVCKSHSQPVADVDVFVDLDWLYPSLMAVRRNLLRLSPVTRFSFRWLSAEKRFQALPVEAALLPSGETQSRLAQGVWPRSIMGALPLDSTLVTGGVVESPNWQEPSIPALIANYFPSASRSDLTQPSSGGRRPMAFALALVPPSYQNASSPQSRLLPVLAIRPEGTSPSDVAKRLQSAFRATNPDREVFIRTSCKELVVLTPAREALDLVDATCASRRPSLGQLTSTRTPFVGQPLTSFIMVDIGRAMAFYIESGWRSRPKATPALPPELLKARDHVLLLPSLIYAGRRDERSQKWSMASH